MNNMGQAGTIIHCLGKKPWSFSVFASLVASVLPQDEREPFSLLTFMSILVKHVVWYVVDYLSAHKLFLTSSTVG